MPHVSTHVNSLPSSFHVDIQHIAFENSEFTNEPERLPFIAWMLLCDMNCVRNVYQKDYGYTPAEIVSRWSKKSKPIKTSVRSIERAFSELYEKGYIEDTERVNLPQHGKEKFRGKYRRPTLSGLGFIQYHEQLKAKVAIDKTKSANNPRILGVVAELLAELNGQITYSHVASQPPSRVHKEDIRSNLDLSIICSKSERFDFNNQCFEEYAAQQSNALPYIEQEAVKEEIYEPVEPKYRPVVKTLLDGSGLENEGKKEVIEAIHRQQNCSTKINNIRGLTKKFIAIARVKQRDKIQSGKHASFKPFNVIEMTEEEKEKCKILAALELKKIREIINRNSIN